MLPRIVTFCKNCQILICGPLKIKSLHLMSKFQGFIFNDLGEKQISKLPPEILRVHLENKLEARMELWLQMKCVQLKLNIAGNCIIT